MTFPETGLSENETDQRVLWAFGHAMIQSEATLFWKLTMMSGGITITHEDLHRHLEGMRDKGYVTCFEFRGMRCWRRLVEEIDARSERIQPELDSEPDGQIRVRHTGELVVSDHPKQTG